MSEIREEPAPEIPWTLHYFGPGVQGEMNAREAGASITAMADLIQAANAAGIWGNELQPEVRLKPAEPGSFVLVAAIVWAAAHADQIEHLLECAALVGAAIDTLRNHLRVGVKNFEHLADRGTVKVTWTDKTVAELTEAQWELYNSQLARKALRKIADPIDGKKVTGVEVTSGATSVHLEQSDKRQLEEPEPDRTPPQTSIVWASPVTVHFDTAGRWTIATLAGNRTVTIEDTKFLRGIEKSQISLRRSDELKVRLRHEQQKQTDGTVTHRYFVEEVLEHREGAEQHELFDGEG